MKPHQAPENRESRSLHAAAAAASPPRRVEALEPDRRTRSAPQRVASCAPPTNQPGCRCSAECSLPLPADHKLLAAFAGRRRRPARRSRRRPRHREIRLRRRAAPSNTRQQALLAPSHVARHDTFACACSCCHRSQQAQSDRPARGITRLRLARTLRHGTWHMSYAHVSRHAQLSLAAKRPPACSAAPRELRWVLAFDT